MNDLANGLLWYLAFVFSMVVHEASHAFVAFKLGDRTAKEAGQVTLDPVPHMKREPIGTIAVPILSFLISGWMIGWASAPYDPDWARRHPDRSALMSLAGPTSNFFLVLVSGAAIKIGVAQEWFYTPETIDFTQVVVSYQDGTPHAIAVLLSIMFTLNLILGFFNLIPVPPLDGSGVIPLFLSKNKAVRYLEFIHNTPMLFVGLFMAWEVFDQIYHPLIAVFLNLLYPGAGYH